MIENISNMVKESKLMAEMYQWRIEPVNFGKDAYTLQIVGNVRNHVFIPDTTYIYTSDIKKININTDKRLLIVETQNTYYNLNLAFMDCSKSFDFLVLDDDRECYIDSNSNLIYTWYIYFLSFYICKDESVISLIKKLRHEGYEEEYLELSNLLYTYYELKIEDAEQFIQDIFTTYKADLFLTLSDCSSYYFVSLVWLDETKTYQSECEAKVHVGTFQDSVIIRGKISDVWNYKYDVRYFPYQGSSIKIYNYDLLNDNFSKSDRPLKLVIKNDGINKLNIGTTWGMKFIIEPNDYVILYKGKTEDGIKEDVTGSDLYPPFIIE